ncbi:universal stress protein [Spirosoma fluviale]|uniref:Nucleotide-binding universal stress protein, UspA family n=1 Tax=Spirosoma fluviale TaxID=1597977 RepID=A0A286GBI7_9BACT|nr:universal stress protein [Spirosoma fluviale]SOD92895.1 Nucleotide-binding universal stress protein, UspA family [Spirosoma fluviale]
MIKILILTDFSEASRQAFTFARSFFKDTVVDFHLLSVFPPEDDGFYGLKHNNKSAEQATTDQLQVIVDQLHQQATTDRHTFRASAQSGHPLDAVERAVATEDYDYVVIGPQTNGINELFGNNAIALVHRLKANILIVPADDLTETSACRFVLAIDFANLKNASLLEPLKELMTLKNASLELLTIDTPDKDVIPPEQEAHIRHFLDPIRPTIARLSADSAKEGIDAYLVDHQVDLLITIPRRTELASLSAGHSISTSRLQAYTPAVPLLTLYDDGSDDLPHLLLDELSNSNYTR